MKWLKKNNLLKLYAKEQADEIIDSLSWKKRRRRKQWLYLLNWFVWLMVAVLIIGLINLAALYPVGRDFYASVQRVKQSYGLLEQALSSGDAEVIGRAAEQANDDAAIALENIKTLKHNPLSWLPYAHQRILDTENLLAAASLSSGSIAELWNGAQPLFRLLPKSQSLDFNGMSPQDKQNVLSGVLAGRVLVPAAINNLATARARLAAIEDKDFFWQYGLDIKAVDERLAAAEVLLKQAEPIAEILPGLAGFPEPANYLFILQNKDELRPTGGFIGTFGLGQTSGGEIVRLDTHDIYHLDMPVKDKFKTEPPSAIKKYLGQNNWYLRDANWSPDWPTTAEKILWFYKEENKLLPKPYDLNEFDYVIALTPDLIVDLLKLTGPVNIRGQVYNQNNFTELLESNTEKDFAAFGLSRWDRKIMVGEIAAEMEKRLMSNLNKNWQPVIGILVENLNKKNIMVYAADNVEREFFARRGWDGRIAETDGDFLMVVDANMGALKTDAVINRQISYQVEETGDGLVAKLDINYAHQGGRDWRTSQYRTFTRVYVPEGSKLIRVAGFFGSDQDIVTGTESGKTYFGAFTQIDPGKLGGLSFEYRLPYNLYDKLKNNGYRLSLQKQPGSSVSEARIDLSFKRPIKEYQPVNLEASLLGSRVVWRSSLDYDRNYLIRF